MTERKKVNSLNTMYLQIEQLRDSYDSVYFYASSSKRADSELSAVRLLLGIPERPKSLYKSI